MMEFTTHENHLLYLLVAQQIELMEDMEEMGEGTEDEEGTVDEYRVIRNKLAYGP